MISITRLTKANRALLEQNLLELNRKLARARKENDEESIVILEAQVNSTIRELDKWFFEILNKIRGCGLTRQQKTLRRLGDVK